MIIEWKTSASSPWKEISELNTRRIKGQKGSKKKKEKKSNGIRSTDATPLNSLLASFFEKNKKNKKQTFHLGIHCMTGSSFRFCLVSPLYLVFVVLFLNGFALFKTYIHKKKDFGDIHSDG